MNFFKTFGAALLALIVFSLLGIILLIVIISAVGSEEKLEVKANSVLHLELDVPITELEQPDPFDGLPIPGAGEGNIGLIQLKEAIANAKNDANIKGIYLESAFPVMGYATLEEIRESLLDFRKSGKWVVAFNETMSEPAYYLATAADSIYMYPEGELEFNGLTIEVSFFKRLLGKLEINPQVFRVGEFKSAVEPFLLEKMSEENRLQLNEMVQSINSNMLQKISEARSLPVEKLREMADNPEVSMAPAAKEAGLVDALYFDDQFQDNLRQRMGLGKDEKISFVKYGKYRKSFSSYKSSPNEIAVIVAEGTIMPGDDEDQAQIIAGERFVNEIRKARMSDKVKAIIIRINSPGGEFRASDMMWREIQLAKKEKPVIASLGDYAASGGYYMAMGCDTIVTQPNTITGSIGIFGVMFDMSNFLGNKIGITFDQVKTGKHGEMYTVTRPLTEAERSFLQRSLEKHYDTFVTKAAEGRDMAKEDVLKVASGRVWTGSQAIERNLTDVIGGFNDAVKIAAQKAGIEENYKLKFYPRQKSFLEQWTSQAQETKASTIRTELGEYYPLYLQLQKLKTYQGAQARLPFELQIH